MSSAPPPSNQSTAKEAFPDSPDAAFHEEMLADEEAAAVADIVAVKQAVAFGIPSEFSVRHMAGILPDHA